MANDKDQKKTPDPQDTSTANYLADALKAMASATSSSSVLLRKPNRDPNSTTTTIGARG